MAKRKLSKEINGFSAKKGAKRPRIASNGHRLPDPIPKGEILVDLKNNQWKLGRSIGLGGFGEIYLATNTFNKRQTDDDAKYVIKIEPHSNGPLFSEMHFYFRVGKPESIQAWMQKKKLKFLGMPKFISSGSHEYEGVKYRFMILERFGDDLQKLLEKNNRVFPLKTVYTLGVKILNILEYVHSHGYIHCDVKAANLTSGFGPSHSDDVHLIDFGLACKYMCQGVHKEYKEDLRKAHDGTIEYTSRDAHIGAHSRRGDLEILGYNMLQWLCGSLPWEDQLKDPEFVLSQKKRYMSDIRFFMKMCFLNKPAPDGIAKYLTYVANLKFDETPDYNHCCNMLIAAIKALGYEYDGKLVYTCDRYSPAYVKVQKKSKYSPVEKLNSPPMLRRMASESASIISTPCKKVRRVASATPRLQSIKLPKPSITEYIATIDNPTPAMLMVMHRKLEQLREQAELAKKEKCGIMRNAVEKSVRNKISPLNGDMDYISELNRLKMNWFPSKINGHELVKSKTNGHLSQKTTCKVNQMKSSVVKKKNFQRTLAARITLKKKLIKKAGKRQGGKLPVSPIAGRTRHLKKTRDHSNLCQLRSHNFNFSAR